VWSILSRKRHPREVEIVVEQPTQPVEVVVTDE
jgi:hypothetical protein